jgi:hypothetical protein
VPNPIDTSISGMAWSPTADPASAWWHQTVLFQGESLRRHEVAERISAVSGMTINLAAFTLENAKPASGTDATRPPWYWDTPVHLDGRPVSRRQARESLLSSGVSEPATALFLDTAEVAAFAESKLDPEGHWATSAQGRHYHVTKDGDVDAGSPQIRDLIAGKKGGGDKDFMKNVRAAVQLDKKHSATIDRMAGGSKVADKNLQAAHDHFKTLHDAHAAGLKEATAAGDHAGAALHGDGVKEYGGKVQAAAGELQKRSNDKAEKEMKKSGEKYQKADAKHEATYQKVKDGGKATRKALQDAHDHFKGKGDLASETLSRQAGPKGERLLTIPHDEHMGHLNNILDAGARQDVLKKAIDQHDATAANKGDKSKKTKGEKATPKAAESAPAKPDNGKPEPKPEPNPEPKPEPKEEPKESSLPAHEIKLGIQKAYNESKTHEDAIPSLTNMFGEAKKQVPGLSLAQFHEHVKALEKSGHLELHGHDNPSRLTAEEASHGIKADGDRLKYFGLSRTGDEPWARGPHDAAADAAHQGIQAAHSRGTPASRTDIFNSLAGKSNLPSTAAGAAAREIHAKMTDAGHVSRDQVREIVNRHGSHDEQAKQRDTVAQIGKAGTNHAAGAMVNSMLEEHTRMSGAGPHQVSKKNLPSHAEIADRISTATGGRLTGPAATKAAKDVLSHVKTHGFDFMSGHDIKGILDSHSKNDWKHSSSEDMVAGLKGGAEIHPKHLQRAQDESSLAYQKVQGEGRNLLEKHDFDTSKMDPSTKKKYDKLTSQEATHGSHIDALNDALIAHKEKAEQAKAQAKGASHG